MHEYEFNGKTYYLFFNGNAYFRLTEILGEDSPLNDVLTASFPDLCKIAALLAEQGELLRRLDGYDKQAILTAAELQYRLPVPETSKLKMAVLAAINQGLRVNSEPETDIDVGLQELAKKNGSDELTTSESG